MDNNINPTPELSSSSKQPNHKWYIVNVIPGRENKVIEAINAEIIKSNIQSMIPEIIVPTEFAPGMKAGKRVAVEKKLLPGYIMVKMQLNDLTQTMIRGLPGVLGFVGNARKPQPVPESQIKHLLEMGEESKDKCNVETYSYNVGDMIKVVDGPFDGFSAIINEIENERKVAQVSVSIFGRETSMSLNFDQMHRIVD